MRDTPLSTAEGGSMVSRNAGGDHVKTSRDREKDDTDV